MNEWIANKAISTYLGVNIISSPYLEAHEGIRLDFIPFIPCQLVIKKVPTKYTDCVMIGSNTFAVPEEMYTLVKNIEMREVK